jgi:hypothetical protein
MEVRRTEVGVLVDQELSGAWGHSQIFHPSVRGLAHVVVIERGGLVGVEHGRV